jgi:enamine deaminase RidA (YjgF/YER057c/UK114 family)
MRHLLPVLLLALASCASTGTGVRVLNPEGRADTVPYSHAVLAGDTLYVAGTLGVDPDTGQAPADVREEVRLLLEAFQAKLALADMTMDDLVSVQVFCPDLSLYGTFNELYAASFEGTDWPVRAFVGSGPLLRGARFEMNGIAVRR